MAMHVIADCKSLVNAYQAYTKSDFNDFGNSTVDVLRNFIRFIGQKNIKLVLCPSDISKHQEILTIFLSHMSDTKSKDEIIKDAEVHELVDNNQSVKSKLTQNKYLIFKAKNDEFFFGYSSRYQKLGFNSEQLMENWKRFTSIELPEVPKHFMIDRTSSFKWDQLKVYSNPTEYIIIEDPYLATQNKEEFKANIIPIIKTFLPYRHKKSTPIQIALVFAKYKTKKNNINLEELIESIRDELKNETKIRIGLYPIQDEKMHDRQVYTENIIIKSSTSFDFMAQNGKVIPNLNKFYSIDVFGIGCAQKFENLEKQLQNLKKEFLILNRREEFYGDALFVQE